MQLQGADESGWKLSCVMANTDRGGLPLWLRAGALVLRQVGLAEEGVALRAHPLGAVIDVDRRDDLEDAERAGEGA